MSEYKKIFVILFCALSISVSAQNDKLLRFNSVNGFIENQLLFGKIINAEAFVFKKNKIKKISTKDDKNRETIAYHINQQGYIYQIEYKSPDNNLTPELIIAEYDSLNRLTKVKFTTQFGSSYTTDFFYSGDLYEKIIFKFSKDTIPTIFYPVYGASGLLYGLNWGKNYKYLFLYDEHNRLISSQSFNGKEWYYEFSFAHTDDSFTMKRPENYGGGYEDTYTMKNNRISKFTEKSEGVCVLFTKDYKAKIPFMLSYVYNDNGLLKEVIDSRNKITYPGLYEYEYYSE